jgi:hypothetical protein
MEKPRRESQRPDLFDMLAQFCDDCWRAIPRQRGDDMSIPQIVGVIADPGENDPVEIRAFQVEGTAVGTALGFPNSPVYTNRPDFPSQRKYWQYFSNGLIVSGFNTCAQALFGPILDYYATVGQFNGHMGCPSTDIKQAHDGTSFAAFENGVLWLDSQGTIHELQALAPILIKAYSGIDPTPTGIAAFAQAKMNSLAQQAIQNNSQLKDNVSSINATVQFLYTGAGGCTGASTQIAGTSLQRSHIFQVHFDFNLTGCAGAFGNASADLHITARVRIIPPSVSAFLESFNIDAVSSPFGAGDSDITTGLSNALYQQQGVDLIGASLPAGAEILAAVVDEAGNVNAYQEPMCMSSSMVSRAAQPGAEATLAKIRRLRDHHVLGGEHGKAFTQIVESFGPVLTEAIRREKNAPELRAKISQFLLSHFHEHADLEKLAKEITEPSKRAVALLNAVAKHKREGDLERVRARSVRFIREEVRDDAQFAAVMAALTRMLREEEEHIAKRGDKH